MLELLMVRWQSARRPRLLFSARSLYTNGSQSESVDGAPLPRERAGVRGKKSCAFPALKH